MELKDIYLGNIDAKNELLNGDDAEKQRFLNSFVNPPNLVIDNFIDKYKYYILGLKGTGKTAILRYLSIQLEKLKSNTLFILFKSDIDEDLRKDIARASRAEIAERNIDDYPADDYESVWRWFIYRKIVSYIIDNDIYLFKNDTNYQKFIEIVTSPTESDEKSGLSKLIPSMKKGVIELSRNPKFSIEFDWNTDGKAKIKFNDLVRKADEVFELLRPGNSSLSIFFDELELNYSTSKQHRRDAHLIRDIIVSIEKINAKCKQKKYNICLYCAVRSEVQISVSSIGKEINKPLMDFGVEILWNRKGIDVSQQPLLYVITKRLSSNLNRSSHLSDKQIWEEFFPTTIQGQSSQEYILHNSWYRPRDVIRILKIAQDQYPNETSFKHQVFDAIRKSYSTDSWVEMTEELKSKYSEDEIVGIKRILYGYRQIFTLDQISLRIEEIKKWHKEIQLLTNRHGIHSVLSDLFRIGIIGNINGRMMRFSFRGDDEILFDQSCFVHNGLRAYLSINTRD